LAPYEGEVYRAIDAKFDAKALAIGTRIKWSTFSTCSLEWQSASELIRLKRGLVYVVQSRTGRVVNRYSKSPIDAEVIFLPGTDFEIVSYYKGALIALGQANIRKTSYAAKPREIDEAARGEACLIIELREVAAEIESPVAGAAEPPALSPPADTTETKA
jgi:hypothetical protein